MAPRPICHALPIDGLLPDVVAAMRGHGALVLQAPPGAGKTTRVPRAFLQMLQEQGIAGEILVQQPRRLATRLAAQRVAQEWGDDIGQTVGYTVRFDDKSGAQTRVRFVTEGVLIRRLMSDPKMSGVAMVILDEFHERHLASDLALGLLKTLRATRRTDLGLCVMSATLDAEPVAAYLDGCPVLTSEGRAYPVDIRYGDDADDVPLPKRAAAAVRNVLREMKSGTLSAGDILVFLPGAGEIRRCADELAQNMAGVDALILPLHGDLSLAEQNRAVQKADKRKIILATNVAETSVTIDGVTVVVDGGTARVASHSPWTGLPTLKVAKISQASAVQRAGRAGRTAPGVALRLYSQHDFDARRAYDLPEVARADLADAALALAALGVSDRGGWDWFERPPDAALAAAEKLLRLVHAVGTDGLPSADGRTMLKAPTHPRLARLLVEGARRGVLQEAAVVAAILGERDIRDTARIRFNGRNEPEMPSADLLEVLDLYEQAARAKFAPNRLRGLGLSGRPTEAVSQAARHLARVPGLAGAVPRPKDVEARDQALSMSILAAFPDRVAMRRSAPGKAGKGRGVKEVGAGDEEIVLCAGGAARIGRAPEGKLLVAVDIAEQEGFKGARRVQVRLAVPIEAEWLFDLPSTESNAGENIGEEESLIWNPGTTRVDRVARMTYGAVVLDEDRRPADASPDCARVLWQAVRDAGPTAYATADAVADLQRRIALLTTHGGLGQDAAQHVSPEALESVVRTLCESCVSFAELRDQDPVAQWVATMPADVQKALRQVPATVRFANGGSAEIHYEDDRPPWIQSRLQDFFGMQEGPSILGGRVPLTLHLLAPNKRAVQVTSDLGNFWKQHYPPLRRELGRKYPRHHWPEDGANAEPPPKGRIRPG